MLINQYQAYTLFLLLLLHPCPLYAATPRPLEHAPFATLHPDLTFKTLQVDQDNQARTHVLVQQYYQGIPISNAYLKLHTDVYNHANDTSFALSQMHQPASSELHGVYYENIANDLPQSLTHIYSQQHADFAGLAAMKAYAIEHAVTTRVETSQPYIYIDAQQKAHWAYRITLIPIAHTALPHRPVLFVDASTQTIYAAWDDLKTLQTVTAGGSGGNPKIGRLSYDGLAQHRPVLTMQRNNKTAQCYLQNTDVIVKDLDSLVTISFPCLHTSDAYPHLFWDGEQGSVNEGYSPDNDALYVGQVVQSFYHDAFGIPVLRKPGAITMLVHGDMENAYWQQGEMAFGDGGENFYPLVSVGVAAHEISHGFTEFHSNLQYYGQSGGLNESYSDMAAKAAEFYVFGKNDWEIGNEVLKAPGAALRYLDDPSKDCRRGAVPGRDCSISHVREYHPDTDVHFSSGIYNKVFYELSISPGWDTLQAFRVMLTANLYYWTPNETFESAACGVLDAARDLKKEPDAVLRAFASVGIAAKACASGSKA